MAALYGYACGRCCNLSRRPFRREVVRTLWSWVVAVAAVCILVLALGVGRGEGVAPTAPAPAPAAPTAPSATSPTPSADRLGLVPAAGSRSARTSARPPAHQLPRLCDRGVAACVDLKAGLAWLQRSGRITAGPFPIRAGTTMHPTPRGTFHVSWKVRYRTSSIYGLPMPYAVYFAAGGVAFHAGSLDTPSHGCAHLSRPAARLFFTSLTRGDVVVVR